MTTTAIRIVGAEDLLAPLAAEPATLLQLLEAAIAKELLQLQAILARYPAAPPGSTYHRTGQLGRLWTAAPPTWDAHAHGFVGAIGNATSYGPYVQDATQQSPHARAWPTVQATLDARTGDLILAIGTAIADTVATLNG